MPPGMDFQKLSNERFQTELVARRMIRLGANVDDGVDFDEIEVRNPDETADEINAAQSLRRHIESK